MRNKEKILEKAQKYIQRGAYEKAIAEYRALKDMDPGDVTVRLRLGDLLVQMGMTEEAIQEYTAVAKAHARRGFYLKAIAVYKRILKLEGSNTDIHYKLAELYAKQRLIADAMSQYTIILSTFEQKGMDSEALDLLKKMVELDPSNLGIRLRLAALYRKLGYTDDALALYSDICSRFVEAGNARKAEDIFLDLYRESPEDPKVLRGLMDLYRAMGEKEKFITYGTMLLRNHIRSGELEEASQVSKEILEMDPAHEESLGFLESYAPEEMPGYVPETDHSGPEEESSMDAFAKEAASGLELDHCMEPPSEGHAEGEMPEGDDEDDIEITFEGFEGLGVEGAEGEPGLSGEIEGEETGEDRGMAGEEGPQEEDEYVEIDLPGVDDEVDVPEIAVVPEDSAEDSATEGVVEGEGGEVEAIESPQESGTEDQTMEASGEETTLAEETLEEIEVIGEDKTPLEEAFTEEAGEDQRERGPEETGVEAEGEPLSGAPSLEAAPDEALVGPEEGPDEESEGIEAERDLPFGAEVGEEDRHAATVVSETTEGDDSTGRSLEEERESREEAAFEEDTGRPEGEEMVSGGGEEAEEENEEAVEAHEEPAGPGAVEALEPEEPGPDVFGVEPEIEAGEEVPGEDAIEIIEEEAAESPGIEATEIDDRACLPQDSSVSDELDAERLAGEGLPGEGGDDDIGPVQTLAGTPASEDTAENGPEILPANGNLEGQAEERSTGETLEQEGAIEPLEEEATTEEPVPSAPEEPMHPEPVADAIEEDGPGPSGFGTGSVREGPLHVDEFLGAEVTDIEQSGAEEDTGPSGIEEIGGSVGTVEEAMEEDEAAGPRDAEAPVPGEMGGREELQDLAEEDMARVEEGTGTEETPGPEDVGTGSEPGPPMEPPHESNALRGLLDKVDAFLEMEDEGMPSEADVDSGEGGEGLYEERQNGADVPTGEEGEEGAVEEPLQGREEELGTDGGPSGEGGHADEPVEEGPALEPADENTLEEVVGEAGQGHAQPLHGSDEALAVSSGEEVSHLMEEGHPEEDDRDGPGTETSREEPQGLEEGTVAPEEGPSEVVEGEAPETERVWPVSGEDVAFDDGLDEAAEPAHVIEEIGPGLEMTEEPGSGTIEDAGAGYSDEYSETGPHIETDGEEVLDETGQSEEGHIEGAGIDAHEGPAMTTELPGQGASFGENLPEEGPEEEVPGEEGPIGQRELAEDEPPDSEGPEALSMDLDADEGEISGDQEETGPGLEDTSEDTSGAGLWAASQTSPALEATTQETMDKVLSDDLGLTEGGGEVEESVYEEGSATTDAGREYIEPLAPEEGDLEPLEPDREVFVTTEDGVEPAEIASEEGESGEPHGVGSSEEVEREGTIEEGDEYLPHEDESSLDEDLGPLDLQIQAEDLQVEDPYDKWEWGPESGPETETAKDQDISEFIYTEPELEEAIQNLARTSTAGDVFETYEELKTGLENQLSTEDAGTHFNLGKEYLEMELYKEAAREFKIALKDRALEMECYQRLAHCALAEANHEEAIIYFLKVLKGFDGPESERRGFLYDLATAYEASGQEREAEGIFRSIYEMDPKFRNVAYKVKKRSSSVKETIPMEDTMLEVELL